MGSQKINRNFIVAHQSEAKPLIELYRLTKDIRHGAFPVYANESVKLIISGEGKINCAAATAYLGGLRGQVNEPVMWTNLGVAGHAFHPLGSLWRVNKVIDSTSAKIVFPINILRSSAVNSEALVTVDKPETTYPQKVLYDMEACAFFQTVSRFASLEYVNSFKFVSDNQDQPLNEFTLSLATSMIGEQIKVVDYYLNELETKLIKNFNNKIQIIDVKKEIYKKYKLSYAQRLQCEELLKALDVHGEQAGQELLQYDYAKQVLNSLSDRLKKIRLEV